MTTPVPDVGPELTELRTRVAAADEPLQAMLDALREAAFAVNSFAVFIADLEREAKDCEFEAVPAPVRKHLDGRLLQRTAFSARRAQDLSRGVRELAQAVRDLRRDCADLVALLPPAPEGA